MKKHNFFQSGRSNSDIHQETEKLQKALYLISEAASSAMNVEELYPYIHQIIGELVPEKSKQLEEFKKTSEEQYRAIVENSHDGICIFSEHRIVYANKKLCILLGINHQDITTIHIFDYIHPEDTILVRAYIDSYQCDEQKQFSCEARIVKAKGDITFVELNLNKIVYKGYHAIIWTIRDISEQKAAEKLQKALYLISETVNSSLDLDKLYLSVHQIIGDLIIAENFYIALYDESTQTVDFPYHVDDIDPNPGARKNGQGLTDYVIQTGQPMFVSQADHMKLIQEGKIQKSGRWFVNWLGVPLKTAEDKVFGVLAVKTHKESIPYTLKDQEILSFVSNQVAMAIKRKQDEARLQFLSFRDSLSGLYNRRYFEEEMRRMDKRREGSVGIIILDVDGLKLVNDMFGHDSGDTLLSNMAKLLAGCFRDQDVVARIGGDEYAILLYDADYDVVKRACVRVQERIVEKNSSNDSPPLSVSMGFAVSDDPGTSMRQLFKQADNNMYREKLQHNQGTRSVLVQAMMKLLEERDFITEGHTERVEKIAVDLGERYGLSPDKLVDLRLLAKFHDIGKVGIPGHILTKPGRLTTKEMQEMRRHSEIGHRIARSFPDLHSIADFILKHHEWWNGQGYPMELSGIEIPIECRILAIADAYDAMTSQRPYRKAMSHEVAVGEIKRCAGTQFDPQLVQLFLATDKI